MPERVIHRSSLYKTNDITVRPDLNLTELLLSQARPGLPGNSLTGRNITIDGLRDRAGRLAAGLTERFKPVDQSRWAVVLPNSVNYIEVFHAVLWLGGVGCPVNHALKPAEIAHAFVVSRPHFIVAYGPILNHILEAIGIAKETLPEFELPRIVTVLADSKDYPDIEEFFGSKRLAVPHHSDTKQRLASIHLSSGTTGNPKGVALSHFNYVANVFQLLKHDPDHWNEHVRIVSYTPFVHIANTTIPLFLGPFTGMLHCIMPSFNLEGFAKMVQENKATAVQAGGVALPLAKTNITERYDFSSVRHLIAGNLPVDETTYQKMLNNGNWKTVMLYGMTEAAPFVVHQKVGETLPFRKIGSLLPGIEAVLRIEDGTKDAAEGEPGEMWIRGPNVTSGYVFNEEATKNAFKEDGWYNTGDVCTFTVEGHLQIVGRTKELIKYKGFQVSPTEVEQYINGHPDVREAAVGGVWDRDQLAELPTAYIVLHDHVRTERQKVQALKDIREKTDSQVSGYKKLRGGAWEVKVLPRNANGKIVRKRLPDDKTGVHDNMNLGHSRSRL